MTDDRKEEILEELKWLRNHIDSIDRALNGPAETPLGEQNWFWGNKEGGGFNISSYTTGTRKVIATVETYEMKCLFMGVPDLVKACESLVSHAFDGRATSVLGDVADMKKALDSMLYVK